MLTRWGVTTRLAGTFTELKQSGELGLIVRRSARFMLRLTFWRSVSGGASILGFLKRGCTTALPYLVASLFF